jgi:large subunit ribosomal protein L6
MSRIGKKPIAIPQGVDVKIEKDLVKVTGPKGELKLEIHPLVLIAIKDNEIILDVAKQDDKNEKSLWGLFNRLINNMVIGVTKGFAKKLEVVGVGFRVALQGQKLVLNLGFSHQVEYILPQGITGSVEKNIITLTSSDKQLLGETAAQIRRLKKPEPYKGKGIRYFGEIIKKKVGKAVVKSGG